MQELKIVLAAEPDHVSRMNEEIEKKKNLIASIKSQLKKNKRQEEKDEVMLLDKETA